MRARVRRQSLIGQYMQYEQFARIFGMDPNADPQMAQTLNQIISELDSTTTIGSNVIDEMTDDLIIRQYAKAHGIEVSATAVEEAIQRAMQYYPLGTPTPTLTPTSLVYSTLNPTQLAAITPTLTPTVAPTNTPRPTFTPNLSATATLVPSATPSPTPYTVEGYQAQYRDTMNIYAPNGMSEAQFRKIYYESGLIQQEVKKLITADITHEQERVWARHILVADESTAQSVYNQLKGGGDFNTMVANYSIDTQTTEKGGDLGWFGKAKYPPDFADAVWTMEVGAINPPIQTTYGYHLVQVLGHEVRPLTDTEYEEAVNAAFTQWLLDERAAAKIEVNNSWTKYVPTSPTLEQAQANDIATQTAYVSTYFAGQTPSVTR